MFQSETTSSFCFINRLNLQQIDDFHNDHEPTSAILDYCKRKFLRPYVHILSLVSLNPISTDTTKCRAYFSYIQTIILIAILIIGYILQYITSYRCDRGFSKDDKYPLENNSRNETVHSVGELIFGYIIPNSLNFIGFISALIHCKFIDREQLQNLIERSFLISMQPKRLCQVLWSQICLALLMFGCFTAYNTTIIVTHRSIEHQPTGKLSMAGLDLVWNDSVKVVLLGLLMIQNFIEIIILSSYCIECYILKVFITTLSQKLLLNSIDSLDWMREILEFRKLLDRLNNHISIPVAFFIVMNFAYAFSGFVYMFKDFDYNYSVLKVVLLNFINVLLWLILGLIPFIVAASLTSACQSVKANGHQIRVRPFVYHNASSDDLNSMLMFSSSLDMSANIFHMPVRTNYLCFSILITSVVILTLGMGFNLSLLGVF